LTGPGTAPYDRPMAPGDRQKQFEWNSAASSSRRHPSAADGETPITPAIDMPAPDTPAPDVTAPATFTLGVSRGPELPQSSLPVRAAPASAIPASSGPDQESAGPDALPVAGKSVYVIDAFSLIYQVFHAMPAMTSPSGLPVGAVHGFTRDMLDLIEHRKPDYLICAFDHPADTFRHALYTAYKAHRPEMPADLQPQIEPIMRMIDAMGILKLDQPGFEADDVMATVAAEVERLGGECLLVTSDKDCRQLISDKVRMFNIRKGEIFDAESLRNTWGIRPDQVVDFQTLVGDPVDGIPGVPLVGPKSARELLEKYDTLDNLFGHLDEVNGAKRRENLIASRGQVQVSRELCRLRRDVPLEMNWSLSDVSRTGRMDRPRIAALCAEFGFRRLAERLGTVAGAAGAAGSSGTAGAAEPAPRDVTHSESCQILAGGMPSGSNLGVAPPRPMEWIETQEQWDQVRARLGAAESIAFWMDIAGTRPRELVLRGVAFGLGDAGCHYLELPPAASAGVLETAPFQRLRELLEAAGDRAVGHDVKRYWNVLRDLGLDSVPRFHDLLVADYLLHSGERSHELSEIMRRYLPGEAIPVAGLMSSDAVCRDAVSAIEQLRAPVFAALRSEGLWDLYQALELPLVEVLSALEMRGIAIDVGRLQRLSEQLASRLESLEREIYEIAGGNFNIDSPSQLAKVLFDDLGLRSIKKTKTGRSTDAEVLEELAAEHALPARILQFRQLGKLKSTYADALPRSVHPVTGRVHTTLRQDGASTGRLSSHDPNLQNVPIRSESGSEIRAAFVAGESGWRLLAADYSQVELRVLAHFCEDPTLIDSFARDEDIHRRVAAEVFGVALPDVTAEMRRAAKGVNFGIIYGQSAFGLAKAIGISNAEAEKFIEAYFARYPGVLEFMFQVLEQTARNGYVKTILGRRRVIQGVRSPSRRTISRQKNLPERLAINTIIQGSAADLIKIAMIRIHRRLADPRTWGVVRSRMLLQIHDELLFEVPDEECMSVARMVREEMSGAVALRVPLKVDVKSGANWAECEPIED